MLLVVRVPIKTQASVEHVQKTALNAKHQLQNASRVILIIFCQELSVYHHAHKEHLLMEQHVHLVVQTAIIVVPLQSA